MTLSGVLTMPWAFVGSIGTSRTVTSSATTGTRAWIGHGDDGDLLEAALAGLLLGLVDEEERGAARSNREHDPDDDDPPSTLGRILVFHFH
jgi:hypothetical protein